MSLLKSPISIITQGLLDQFPSIKQILLLFGSTSTLCYFYMKHLSVKSQINKTVQQLQVSEKYWSKVLFFPIAKSPCYDFIFKPQV